MSGGVFTPEKAEAAARTLNALILNVAIPVDAVADAAEQLAAEAGVALYDLTGLARELRAMGVG